MIENNIKLVIWDMDETFWKGTLTETEVEIPQAHIDCVQKLVDRGIMNSISSKNNYSEVKDRLEKAGIWDMFVFPKIGWNAKGAQIQEIIRQCRLREQNVLFIDDNFHNLEEAKYVCPMLNVAGPDLISGLLDHVFLQGNEDADNERLRQFKVLEAKSSDQKKYGSNEEFLYQSDIKVKIKENCLDHCERLLDLINRSNQLNYTKIRLTMEELLKILKDPSYHTGYVSVEDRYGDYGIVGFFALKDQAAEHFLFSCRTIGLGVEQYVYAELGYPRLHVKGEVITCLNAQGKKPDWINQDKNKFSEPVMNRKSKKTRILIRGGCDLAQMEIYLTGKRITCEFNHLQCHCDHTYFARSSYYGKKAVLDKIAKKLPFLYRNAFETKLFDKNYDVVVISVLMDYNQAVYSYNKDHKIKIAYGDPNHPLTPDHTNGFSIEELEWFFQNFTCCGRIGTDAFEENLQFIRDHMSPNAKLVIINGAEVPHENPNEPDMYKVHIKYNRVLDDFVRKNQNTELLDIRKIVLDRSDCTNNIRHYQRNIYYQMALELNRIVSEPVGGGYFRVSQVNYKSVYKHMKKSIKKVLTELRSGLSNYKK